MKKETIVAIIIIGAFILLWRAESIWRYTSAQRTMFEFGEGTCQLLGEDRIVCKPNDISIK